MKKILVITNRIKDPKLDEAEKVLKILNDRGAETRLHVYEEESFLSPDPEAVLRADAAVVLGGDGTILRAARDLQNPPRPVLGINLGSVGYLAEVDISDVEEALEAMIEGRLGTEERMMISGESKGQSFDALNEIAIVRNGHLQVLIFKVKINGRYLFTFAADGILVATPTGSTAYNLSAGGPIVEPSASMMVLTPICPHSLKSTPIVLSPDDEIEITLEGPKGHERATVEAVFDGKESIPLCEGDTVKITRSLRSITLLKTGRVSFLETLQKKLSGI